MAAELRLSNSHRQLAVEHPSDFAAGLLSALRPLGVGERIKLQWALSPATSPGPLRPNPILQKLTGSQKSKSPRRDKSAVAKNEGPHFLMAMRIGVAAKDQLRRRGLLRRVLGVFHRLNGQGVSLRRRWLPNFLAVRRLHQATMPLLLQPCFLNAREAATLLALPTGKDLTVPGLELGRARQLPVPAEVPQNEPPFATSNYPGSSNRLTYGLASLPYHAWIVGGTGTGKSTLLSNLISAYMNMGATVVVIDSKRDLVRDVLDLVPAHRVDDLVLLDPADNHPVGLNLLAGSHQHPDRIADQLVGIFTRLWPGSVGPRSQDILRNSFLTLAKTPGTTLVELPLLLLDEGYRRKLVSRLDDPVILEPAWAAFDNLSAAERGAHIAAPLNKVRGVLARRALRDIVGQSDGLDVSEVLERGSILAVPLSKGLIGEDAASLLGSVLLLRIWQTLTARIGLESTNRRPVLLVCDEFQDYVQGAVSFGDMLAQARALGVGVICAHQHLGQLPSTLRQDLRANARTKIAFQLAGPDAGTFAQEFSPFLSAADLQGLGRYVVAAQVCVKGRVLSPATGVTLPPPEKTELRNKAVNRSRQRYGRARQEVDAEIRRRHGERSGPGSVGRRERA